MEHSLEFLEFIRPSKECAWLESPEVAAWCSEMMITCDFWDNCDDMGV